MCSVMWRLNLCVLRALLLLRFSEHTLLLLFPQVVTKGMCTYFFTAAAATDAREQTRKARTYTPCLLPIPRCTAVICMSTAVCPLDQCTNVHYKRRCNNKERQTEPMSHTFRNEAPSESERKAPAGGYLAVTPTPPQLGRGTSPIRRPRAAFRSTLATVAMAAKELQPTDRGRMSVQQQQ